MSPGKRKQAHGSAIHTREEIGISALERYTGSSAAEFQPQILLTNFGKYLDLLSEQTGIEIRKGSAFSALHWPKEGISMVNFGVGSPTAALIVELLSFIRTKGVLMLGLCGGLREKHEMGHFFNPVAGIRDEGTSDHYLPPQVPALSSFTIQRLVARELDRRGLTYHTGVIHTTNYRFWEFNEEFKEKLRGERVQTIDMECATLFSVGFARSVVVGALMVISDTPLRAGGVKTKESSQRFFRQFAPVHLETGIQVLRELRNSPEGALKFQW